MLIKINDKFINKYVGLDDLSFWAHVCIVNDINIKTKVIFNIYNNSLYPNGTIVVSDKILNEFPEAIGSWTQTDENYIVDRSYLIPSLRGKYIGKECTILQGMFAYFLKKEAIYVVGSHPNGDLVFNSAFDLGLKIDKKYINPLDTFEFKDWTYPIINYGKRMVYDETKI
jgi:hypothetical protein